MPDQLRHGIHQSLFGITDSSHAAQDSLFLTKWSTKIFAKDLLLPSASEKLLEATNALGFVRLPRTILATCPLEGFLQETFGRSPSETVN
jgi:hypothetical protein